MRRGTTWRAKRRVVACAVVAWALSLEIACAPPAIARTPAEAIGTARFLGPTPRETVAPPAARAEVVGDRAVYASGDGGSQALALFFGHDVTRAGAEIILSLRRAGASVATRRVAAGPGATPKLAFFFNSDALAPGDYTLDATLVDSAGQSIAVAKPYSFTRGPDTSPRARSDFPAGGVPLGLVVDTDARQRTPDGAWPISMGFPVPFGALTDPSQLALLEDGKAVPAQWTVRATWSPPGAGPPVFVKWLGLDFLARSAGGVARRYVVAKRPAPTLASSLDVREDAEVIEVSTGAIRFVVKKGRFTGVDAAWVDANGDARFAPEEKVVAAGLPPADAAKLAAEPAGAYVVDGRGLRYDAASDPHASVIVEERGPVRVSIVARGWYANPELSDEAGKRLCQFVTRIHAYAGERRVHVTHHTVLTFDTRAARLADVGFALPVAAAVGGGAYRLGLDGAAVAGPLPERGGVFVHQDRWDHARVVVPGKPVVEGARADGWLAIATPPADVSVALRDVWQKFPKELEADRRAITLHFWPKHGHRVFTEAEETARANIYKLWFAHQGRQLDLRLPPAYFDQLQAWNDADGWDVERSSAIGFAATGQGLAIGNDFAIGFDPPGSLEAAPRAAQFQSAPHAVAASRWTVDSGVFPPMAARDDRRWPEVEALLGGAFPRALSGLAEHAHEYGMWIYGNTHNGWFLQSAAPDLHRVWQNGHYGHVSFPWMLYARSGSPALLRGARAQTSNYMDVATINYDDPTVKLKYHIAGAMYHGKGFVPWGARLYGMPATDVDAAATGHFVDPDAFLLRGYLEGDGRARDLYELWGRALGAAALPSAAGREAVATLSHALGYYEATWDPQALLYRHDLADTVFSTPFARYADPYAWPVWNVTWMSRYFAATRDPRLVVEARRWVDAGFGAPAVGELLFRATGERRYLDRFTPRVFDAARRVYRAPGDPFDHFGSYTSAVASREMAHVPFFLAGLERAGAAKLEAREDLAGSVAYPAAVSRLDNETTPNTPALTLFAVDPDDRSFALRIDGRAPSPVDVVVVAPSGKIVRKIELRPAKKINYDGANAESFAVPRDGERGVYEVRLFGYVPALIAPLTTLPHEAMALPKGARVTCGGRTAGVLAIAPGPVAGANVTLDVAALGNARVHSVAYVRVGAPMGTASLLETTLLAGASRSAARVELAGAGPWPLYTASEDGPALTWSGAPRALFFARTRADLHGVFAAQAR